jgi:hypothetical protein
MKIFILLLLTLISFCQLQTLAQEKPKSKNERTVEERISQPVLVKFGKKDDGFAESLKIRGTIIELTFGQAYCGTIFWSGTVKVKLLNKIEGYPYENVFVVVPCFLDPDNEEKYLNKTINLEVSKSYDNYNRYDKKKPCYFEIITNNINSGGVPFYCSKLGQEELLKNIEREATSQK